MRPFGSERPGHRPAPDAGVAERPEHKRRTYACEAEELGDVVANGFEDDPANGCFQDDEGKHDLQTEAPRHRGPIDGAAIRRKGIADAENDEGAKNRLDNTRHQ